MPNGDDTQQEEIVEEPQGINIFAPEMLEDVSITLTRGQATFIYGFLEQNIQPRGFAMVEFAYDMQNRMKDALDMSTNVEVETVEALETVSTTITTPKPVFDDVSVSTNDTKEE